MHAHSQYCWSGDHTLESTEWAVSTLSEEDCDEAILVVLSDANLQRYGIPASKLAQALISKPTVSAYAIFIGSLGDQAERYIVNQYLITYSEDIRCYTPIKYCGKLDLVGRQPPSNLLVKFSTIASRLAWWIKNFEYS